MTSEGLDATSAEPRDGSHVIDLAQFENGGAKTRASPSCGRMAINVRVPPGPQRTRALLEEIAGGRRGVQLRAQVAAAKRGATREQIEEAFQEACIKADRSCRGQTMGEVYKWLLRTTDSTVDDMRDRLKREVLVDHCAREFQTDDPGLVAPDEVLIKREERAELDAVALAILDRLDERERKIAVLHSHGFARNDIAQHLGVTPRIVKRDVEGILKTSREQLAKLVGSGCPDGHRLVSRYAFGLTGGREARQAQLHLATCARCGTMFERLDLWRERVAALLPVPPAIEAHTDIVERVVHASTDVLSSAQPSAEGAPSGLRRHFSDAAAYLREQATSAYYRTVDPTPLASVRPGAVAAAVAGCLAVGGGATYCAKQGADPFTAFSRFSGPEHHEKKPNSRPKRARAAQAPEQPVVTPTVAPPAVQQQPTPQATTTATTPAALPPAPEDEYEPTSPSATTSSSPATTSSNTREPAAAPADGPGEFEGP